MSLRCPAWPALQGGAGARLPVTLAQCAVACTGAPGCDMFTYNPVQQGCFLKSGQCPLRNDCQVELGLRTEQARPPSQAHRQLLTRQLLHLDAL